MERPVYRIALALIGWLCSATIGACRPDPPGPLDDLPSLQGLQPDPARIPGQAPAVAESVSLCQIVVAYHGVYQPAVKLRWNLAQARARAERLVALARSQGQDFAALAKRFSDDSTTSGAGGSLGVVEPGQLHPDLEAAGFGLQIGQVSEPVNTPTGWVILMRQEPSEAQAAEIVISFTGAQRYEPRQPRSRDEAAELARLVHQRLVAGAAFQDVAFEHSDRPDWVRGGFEPIFKKGQHRFPQFEQIVWGLPIGGLSEPIETSSGFHIVTRWPVRRIGIRVMRVGYRPDDQELAVDPRFAHLPRRELARARIERVRSQVVDQGGDFAALAVRLADTATRHQASQVERIGRGEIPWAAERAAFGLQAGELSAVLDIEGAFFLIKRVF